MGILQVHGLAKSYGPDLVFQGVGFQVGRGDKVGIVGPNGAGKTTLLRCLMGRERADAGSIQLPAGERIGYVEQELDGGERSLQEVLSDAFAGVLEAQGEMRRLEGLLSESADADQEEYLSRYAAAVERFERGGGYSMEAEIKRVIFGLGFGESDLTRQVQEFSGGQKTRIALARALLSQPDFLILDEPTNHLDLEMVEWLEDFIGSYSGGVILVSHDRYFLDKVAQRILELEGGWFYEYNGNYTRYLAQKADRLEAQANAYEKQQAFIAKTQAFVDRYRAGVKSKQARGREKRLQRLERVLLPPSPGRFDFFNFNPPAECADRVFELEEAAAGYGDRIVFQGLNGLVRRGDGIALVGPNGAGKTTLLKLLAGKLASVAGKVKIGSRVKVGYFSQEHEELDPRRTLVEDLSVEFGFSEGRARHYLAPFLFTEDEVWKRIGDLSGGEKARYALLRLLLTGANVLLLDEPTNHLDIPAKEAVEESLMTFPGTFVVVSHDRYFLDKVANCLWVMEDGGIEEFYGSYSDYRRQKQMAATAKPVSSPAAEKTAAKERKRAANRRPQDQQKELRRLEQEIAKLEEEKNDLEDRLNDPATHADLEVSQQLAERYAAVQGQLDEVYTQWLEAQEE